MKPFNLEEALSGKPVLLRGGQTAVVLYRIPDKYTSDDGQPPAFPLQGLILDAEGFVDVFGHVGGLTVLTTMQIAYTTSLACGKSQQSHKIKS